MDEVRKHPNGAGLRGITSKLTQIREYTDMDKWCAEHTKNCRDVSCLVEHWAKKLTWQLEERKPAFRPIPKVNPLDNAKPQQAPQHRFDLLDSINENHII
jgi:hypothetical protein